MFIFHPLLAEYSTVAPSPSVITAIHYEHASFSTART
jgi:hypothetical protein